jgi:hypothetical protein
MKSPSEVMGFFSVSQSGPKGSIIIFLRHRFRVITLKIPEEVYDEDRFNQSFARRIENQTSTWDPPWIWQDIL